MIYEDGILRYKGYRLLEIDGSMIKLLNKARSNLKRYFKTMKVKKIK